MFVESSGGSISDHMGSPGFVKDHLGSCGIIWHQGSSRGTLGRGSGRSLGIPERILRRSLRLRRLWQLWALQGGSWEVSEVCERSLGSLWEVSTLSVFPGTSDACWNRQVAKPSVCFYLCLRFVWSRVNRSLQITRMTTTGASGKSGSIVGTSGDIWIRSGSTLSKTSQQ